MINIILDTNFCAIPFQFHVDIFGELERLIDQEYRLIVPTVCIDEIKKLKQGIATIDLLEKKNIFFLDTPPAKKVDDAILQLAIKMRAVIATQDKELKQKAKKAGLQVITLRQKKYLIIEL